MISNALKNQYNRHLSMVSWNWMAFDFASSASVRLALLSLSSAEHFASNSSIIPFNFATSIYVLKKLYQEKYLLVSGMSSSKFTSNSLFWLFSNSSWVLSTTGTSLMTGGACSMANFAASFSRMIATWDSSSFSCNSVIVFCRFVISCALASSRST